MPTQHGYWSNGVFIPTDTEAEAVDTWRREHGYSTGGVYDMGDRVVDTRNVSSPTQTTTQPAVPAQTTPAVQQEYDVQSLQSLAPNAPTQSSYNVQGIQSLAPAPQQPTTYNVQGIQSLATQPQAGATPAEQAAAQGGDATNIQPYEDLQQWFNPQQAGGYGTPTELRYSAGPGQSNYGPSAVQWSEDANNLALMQQGVSPAQMADNSINAVYAFLTDFDVKPNFITPYVASRLGLAPQDLVSMGYAQDPYGRWILLDIGSPQTGAGGVYDTGGGNTGYSGRGNSGGSSFRSGYTSGLINWRIGL